MDEIKDLLSEIGMSNQNLKQVSSNEYEIELRDVKEYGAVYTLLENSDCEPIEEESLLSVDGGTLMYQSQNSAIIISLEADYNHNTYSVVFIVE